MRYVEERHAKDLHRELLRQFAGTAPDNRVTVEGRGVHWSCDAVRGQRSASVACFDARGPEYLAAFKDREQTGAWGRTRAMADIVNAVAEWLSGACVADLHTRFGFVDRERRALTVLADAAVQFHPALGSQTVREIRHLGCDLYELWFTAGDRSCRVSRYGDNVEPDAYFHWDGCQLFRFQASDPCRLAVVLGRWLCDRVRPSEMRSAFPWIVLDPVARYYEDGRPVEGEFITSWDSVERFYQEHGPGSQAISSP